MNNKKIKGFILLKEYPSCNKKVGSFEPFTSGEFLKYPEIWKAVCCDNQEIKAGDTVSIYVPLLSGRSFVDIVHHVHNGWAYLVKNGSIQVEYCTKIKPNNQNDENESKLKQENESLREQNKFLKAVIQTPPKYQVGQTIGEWLITDIRLNDNRFDSIILNPKLQANIIKLICFPFGSQQLYSKEEVNAEIKKNKELYIYKVFDQINKAPKTLTQSEIDKLLNK